MYTCVRVYEYVCGWIVGKLDGWRPQIWIRLMVVDRLVFRLKGIIAIATRVSTSQLQASRWRALTNSMLRDMNARENSSE